MKSYWLLFCCCIGLSVAALGQNTPRLEIHHIGAGDGDGTLIIAIDTANTLNIDGEKYLDTVIILIDGQRASGGKEVWRYVQDTVNALATYLKKINYVILSHEHIDHYGGMEGLIKSAYAAHWKIGQVIDRQNANYTGYKDPLTVQGECYSELDVKNPQAAAFERYKETLSSKGLTPGTVTIGQNLMPQFEKIHMFCVVAYGLAASPNSSPKDVCFLPRTARTGKSLYTAKSENDLSIGFLLRFQGFNYLTSGDLGGISGGNYVDGETPMTKGIIAGLFTGPPPATYHICANKVSHHGSEESTSTWFATTNNFTVSVFPASLRSYGSSLNALPTKTAIMNLTNTQKDNLLYTFVPKNPQTLSSYWTKGNLDKYNDVIIKLIGNPGYDDISMTVIQHAKSSKKPFGYLSAATQQTIVCNKGHHWNGN